MIVTVSARCERLAAHSLPHAHCRPRGPRIRPGEPAPGTCTGERPWGTRPGSATGTRPAGASPTVRGRPVTGFSEPPLPVPVTVFWVGPAGPAGRADDALA